MVRTPVSAYLAEKASEIFRIRTNPRYSLDSSARRAAQPILYIKKKKKTPAAHLACRIPPDSSFRARPGGIEVSAFWLFRHCCHRVSAASIRVIRSITPSLSKVSRGRTARKLSRTELTVSTPKLTPATQVCRPRWFRRCWYVYSGE